MQLHYVYILKSLKDGNFYTGYTSNLEKRISEHNEGLVAVLNQLYIGNDLNYITKETFTEIKNKVSEISNQLNALRNTQLNKLAFQQLNHSLFPIHNLQYFR